jgi:predicted nuclease of predicted toxin-antitoxin system
MSTENLFIKLYLDEDVHKRLAVALRLRQFDVVSVHELERQGLSDAEQLQLAAQEGRTLFTYNTADFVKLHLDWHQRGETHSGIILSDQLSLAETLRRLLKLLNQITADEICGQAYWLQAFK